MEKACNWEDGIDVSTPYKPTLQQFTPEQIEHYCKNIDCLCQFGMANETQLKEGVQIIKQLQAELADPVFLGDMPAGTVAMSRLQGCDGD